MILLEITIYHLWPSTQFAWSWLTIIPIPLAGSHSLSLSQWGLFMGAHGRVEQACPTQPKSVVLNTIFGPDPSHCEIHMHFCGNAWATGTFKHTKSLVLRHLNSMTDLRHRSNSKAPKQPKCTPICTLIITHMRPTAPLDTIRDQVDKDSLKISLKLEDLLSLWYRITVWLAP